MYVVAYSYLLLVLELVLSQDSSLDTHMHMTTRTHLITHTYVCMYSSCDTYSSRIMHTRKYVCTYLHAHYTTNIDTQAVCENTCLCNSWMGL